jgi:hypothetical protein
MAVSPSSVISGAQGTGTFSSASDAMGGVGSMMKSPASGKAAKMKSDGKSLDITGPNGVDEFAVKNGYPGAQGEEIWDTLQQVQEVSDGFTSCGSFMEEALLAATRDFIRNSGIQQAGRELSKALGQYDDMLDCAAGFATLFESEGVMDDATGAGDLPQLNKRTRSVIEGVTNASSVSNILSNCDAIRGLVSEFDNMCADMMGKINDLIGEDLAALANALNKLAQWAAFAKLATSDPCALVNSNRMLEHVTGPVMSDIVYLYKSATGQLEPPAEPEVSLGDELEKPAGTVVDVPKHKQAPMEGQATVAQISESQPSGVGVIEKKQADSPTGGYDSTPPEYVPGVGWVDPGDDDYPTEDSHGNEIPPPKSDFSKGLEKGETPMDDRNEKFVANVKDVEYKAVAEEKASKTKSPVAKVHKVGWCTGGSGGGANRNEDGCKATDGDWHEKEMTDNEVKVAGSVEAAMGPVAKTLTDTFPEYEAGIPPSSPSSASKAPKITAKKARDIVNRPGRAEARASMGLKSSRYDSVSGGGGATAPIVTKDRDPIAEVGSYYGTWGYPSVSAPYNAGMSDPILSKQGYAPSAFSADPNDPKPFDVATVQQSSGLGILPGTYRISPGAASLPPDTSRQKSNIGGDISEYDLSREIVELAMKTGNWEQVETCACQPTQAVANAKEVGACDFTGLTFPDGYQLVDPANYTEQLIAKVDAAELTGSGQYIVEDGNIYESVEVVVMAKYGATIVDPFEPGKETCQKHSGKWYVITSAVKAVSGGSLRADIHNAKSQAICEAANGEWVCKKGQAGSTGGNKAIESYGKFTNKKNVNTKSKLPSTKAFDTDKLPSLNFSAIK